MGLWRLRKMKLAPGRLKKKLINRESTFISWLVMDGKSKLKKASSCPLLNDVLLLATGFRALRRCTS